MSTERDGSRSPINPAAERVLEDFLQGELSADAKADLSTSMQRQAHLRRRLGILLRREQLLAELCQQQVESEVLQVPVPRHRFSRAVPWALAASLVLGIGAWATWATWPRQQPLPQVAGKTVVAGISLTAVAHSLTLTWPDEATQVIVDPGAVVIPEAATSKRIRLAAGTVRAEVAPQAVETPFEIVTPQATATVLGTRFTLKTTSDGTTRLAVEHGRVRLSDAHGSVAVAAGDVAWSDTRGLWLDPALPPSQGAPVFNPTPTFRLEAPTSRAPSLIPGDFTAYPATKVVHDRTPGAPDGLRLLSGGPWPKGTFFFQAWRSESTAAAAIGPHPDDGTPCITMCTTSGPPAAQFMPRMTRLSAGIAYEFSFRFRTQAQGAAGFWIQIDDVRSSSATLPLAQQQWQWVRATVPAGARTRTFQVSLSNLGRTPQDTVSCADVGLRPLP